MYCINAKTKHRAPTNNGSNNKQWINNNRTTAFGCLIHFSGAKSSLYILLLLKKQKKVYF